MVSYLREPPRNYFPIKVKYLATDETVVVNTSRDIRRGEDFIVLETGLHI
jgi:hypothetical protein